MSNQDLNVQNIDSVSIAVKKDEFTINTGQTNSKKRESLLNKTVIMAQPLNKLGCKKFLSIIIK